MTARKVATTVGVSATAIYRHYASIEDLLHAVRMEGHGLLGGYLGRPPQHLHARERLVAMQELYFRFGREHPRYFAMMFPASLGDAVAPDVGAEEAATLLIVRDAAALGIARGEIRTDLDALLIANYCWLAVHSLTATAVSGHLEMTGPGLADTLLEQVKLSTRRWLRAPEPETRPDRLEPDGRSS